jgi:hypothetical protein
MTEHEALELAKRFANENGWAWLEPARIRRMERSLRPAVWIVHSSGDDLDGIQIEIDDATGHVVTAELAMEVDYPGPGAPDKVDD